MTRLETLFDLDFIRQALSDLARKVPYPGEAEIRNLFAEGRRNKDFAEAGSRKYPQIASMAIFNTKLCDLRATPTTWVEFKHGTSRDYIHASGYDEQGTTKDLFRNVCMDLAKTSLINQSDGLEGQVVLSVLHVGELHDSDFARVGKELETLASVFRITPERFDFPYASRGGEGAAEGVLSIFAFGKPKG